METTTHKQQPEIRESVPSTDPDIHATLDLKSIEEITQFTDETPQQISKIPDEQGVVSSSNPIIDQTLIDILQRPRIISSFKWKSSHTTGSWLARLVLPDELFRSSTVWSKLQQYVFLHAGVKFMFRINGTAYHYGTLAAIWRPIALGKTCNPDKPDKLGSYDSLYSLIQYPHSLLTPSSSQNVEMEVPYQSPLEKIPIKAFSSNSSLRKWANLGILDILVLNPLRASPRSADTPDVSVDIYASFTTPSLFGYTHQSFAFESLNFSIPTRSILPKNLRFPIKITQAKSSNSDLVGTSQTPIVYLPAKLQSSDYNQPSYHLSLSKSRFVPPLDSVNLSEHLSQWSLLDQIECTTTTEVGAILKAYKVMPQNCGVYSSYSATGDIYFNTKLSFISQLFRFWRGPIEYRFDFIASKFHSCRIKIAWYPPGTSKKATAYDLGDTWTKVVDVQGDISVTFTVPFIEPVAYLPYSPESAQFSNGTLVLSLLNSLAYPTPNGPPIACNVWVRAPNLELSGFVHKFQPPRGILSSSDMPDYDPQDPWPGIPGTNKPKQTTQALLDSDPFAPESLDRLSHKPTPFVYLTKGKQLEHTPGVPYQLKSGYYPAELGAPSLCTSLLEYLMLIHVGYKGSLRYVTSNPECALFCVPSAYYENKTTILNSTVKLPNVMYERGFSASEWFPANSNSLKDFSFPMYSSISFRPISHYSIADPDSPCLIPALKVFLSGDEPCPLFLSAAEDFAFVGMGACPMVFYWPSSARPASVEPSRSPRSSEVTSTSPS